MNSTWTMETSQNANPIATPSNTPIPTATITPSTTLNPIPVSGNSNAYITEVVHIENGSQTMAKILFLEKLEGNFFAKVENLWSFSSANTNVYADANKYIYSYSNVYTNSN